MFLNSSILRFVVRALRSHKVSLIVAILGVAIGLASGLSALRMKELFSSAEPIGTEVAGEPLSIFMSSEAMRLDFFLGPRQILGLQESLADSGYVVGSSGTRGVAAQINGRSEEIRVDVVSPNFFEGLGVRIKGASPLNWSQQGAGNAVVSKALVDRLGHTPASVVIKGVSLRVVGTVDSFSGLWDQHTEVWVDWHMGPHILFPTAKGKNVEDQPWFYWALMAAKPGHVQEFNSRAASALNRRDLLEVPFNEFKAIPGVTNQPYMRTTAEDTLRLYLLVCVVALTVAALNLASLSALVRTAKAGSEWTMLCIGMGPATHFGMSSLYVLIPCGLGVLASIPLEAVFSGLMREDPAVSALIDHSPELQEAFPWAYWVGLGAAIMMIALVVGQLAARAAGLKYGAASLRTNYQRLRLVFRGGIVVISACAAVALYVGLMSTVSSLKFWREASETNQKNSWVMEIRLDDRLDRARVSSSQLRLQIANELKSNWSEIQSVGFASIRPFSDGRVPQSTFSLSRQGHEGFSVLVNEIDQDALSALGVRLLSGRLPETEGQSGEIVLDAMAAADLMKLSGSDQVLGMVIQDAVGFSSQIVGVVERLPYSSDISRSPAVAYVAAESETPINYVIIKGDISDRRISELAKRFAADAGSEFYLSVPTHLGDLATKALNRYSARALFCLVAALAAVSIALLSAFSLVSVEVRQRIRDLAIMECLGASRHRVALVAAQPVVVSVSAGSLLGLLAGITVVKDYAQGALLPIEIGIPMLVLPALVFGSIAALGCITLVFRQMGLQSLYSVIRDE